MLVKPIQTDMNVKPSYTEQSKTKYNAYGGGMTMSLTGFMNSMKVPYRLFLALIILLLCATYSYAATPAGYSEYYVPGDENLLNIIWGNIGSTGGVPTTGANAARHTVVNIVAWSPNTIVYYDHWENGYNFDPNNPAATADEVVVLANRGDSHTFESTAIPVNPRGTGTYYDGGDHIYVAGGAVSVTRESWTDHTGTVLSLAWDVYPVKPQMTTYILPFGEDLAAAPTNYRSFDRVFALIQATEDNTTVQFDVNGDGVFDTVCTDITRATCTPGTVVTLNRGQTFLLDDYALSQQAAPYNTIRTGTIIQGSATLQVNYVIGNHSDTYQARGFSAFPSSYWDSEYYSPVDSSDGTGNYPTNVYIYNPHSTALTINYQTTAGSGSFSVPANSTRSFQALTGTYVPQGSGIYLNASDVFWGIANIDDGGPTHEWGYGLIPVSMLSREEFLGWAPSSYPITTGNYDDAGIFVTPLQDNTTVFVDTNQDGVADQTYTLNRLQTQYIYNATTGDMSNSNIWATGPVALAYGQNSYYAPTGSPAIDLGYAVIPGGDFVDKVLTVSKTANPVVVPTSSGSTSTYTIVVDSYYYAVNGISVTDTLPSNWQYVSNSATITLADMTTISGSSANPTITGGNLILTWPSSMLGNMAPNQAITITFTAQTTANFSVGAITRNVVQASGTRTPVAGVTQTFNASDFAFNTYGNLTVTKTSNAASPLYPGNQFTYTIKMTNPSSAAITGVSVYDPLPSGVNYVAGTSQVTGSRYDYFLDNFNAQLYSNQNGTLNWGTNWIEQNDGGGAGSPMSGDIEVLQDGSFPVYALRYNLSHNNRAIARRASLSGYSAATLSFDYRRAGTTNASDAVQVQVCANSTNATPITCSDAGGWTIVATLGGAATDANYISSSYNLASSFLSANFAVRLAATGHTENHNIWFDNIKVTVPNSGTFSAGTPPDLLDGSKGYFVAAGGTLTLTYNVTVDNPLEGGVDQITNTAFVNSSRIPLPVSASVTNLVVNPSSQSASVGGQVWFDLDGDGVQDVGEPGLANVEVTLKDWLGAAVMTTTTDSQGHFLFTGVEPGNGYYVEATSRTIPSGLVQSAPSGRSDNRTNAFNLTVAQSYTGANLGYKAPTGSATIRSVVWSDANSNGVRDGGEPGLGGVTVQTLSGHQR